MHAEVFDDVIDRLEHGHLVILYLTHAQERAGIEAADDVAGFFDDGSELCEQLFLRYRGPLVEFLLAMPLVRSVRQRLR